MQRIKEYFETAKVCDETERKFGMEVETLFVDSITGSPISLSVSQEVWKKLVSSYGWKIHSVKNGVLTELKKDGYRIVHELGWNNFEINTPAVLLRDKHSIFTPLASLVSDLQEVSRGYGAKMLFSGYDRSRENTLVLPDKRDKIWIELDGEEALLILGHVACVHYNLDLTSIEEGFEFMRQLTPMYEEEGWLNIGNGWAWQEYINKSKARYNESRYGMPPMTSFEEYCHKLSEFAVVMNKENDKDGLFVVDSPQPACKTLNFDMELFLRSVWWIYRLRKRAGKLVLEIRDVPRGIPFEKSWEIISEKLRLMYNVSGPRSFSTRYNSYPGRLGGDPGY